MDWKTTLAKLAPVVASAFLGPLAGGVVAAVGGILGIEEPTAENIGRAIEDGQLPGEHIAALRQLELNLKAEEAERGFRYADLEFKDRDSARKASVDGGISVRLFYLSVLLLIITLGCELTVMFYGYPKTLPEIIVGRVLGLMDSIAMMVLAFYYGTSSGSQRKTDLLSQGK